MFFKKYLTILILVIPLIFALPRQASAVSWFPLVPCGLNQQPANATRQDVDANGNPIGPHDYTQPCNQCLLIELGKNIIDMTFFAIVPSVGTLMFLIAGFIILFNARSGKAGGVETGKKIMTDTAIGIAIILGAWLITNFILKSIAKDEVANTPWYEIQCRVDTLKNLVEATNPAGGSGTGTTGAGNTGTGGTGGGTGVGGGTSGGFSGGGGNAGGGGASGGWGMVITIASLPDATQNTTYSKSLSVADGTAPYTWSVSAGALPVGLSISGSIISGTPTIVGTSTFTIKAEDSSSPKQVVTKVLTIKVNPAGVSVQCLQSGLNLCQGDSMVGCANSSCNQYADMINRQATGVATASILKAFMEVESSCNIGAVTGTSFGLMQMTPPIPQIYASRCGVLSGDVNRAWLTDPANAEKSICISVQWINALAASQCGPSIRNLYAGYNGGQAGACAPSVSCAGEKSCSNEPMKRWECLYDDTAHTKCNGGTNIMAGYNQTRQGARRIQYCATNPGF